MSTVAKASPRTETLARGQRLQPAIQDTALIGDLHTGALVAKDGSIVFLCLPDFDDGTCFASILGTPEHGYWKITPIRPVASVQRRYRGNTLILETEMTNDEGVVRITDFMPVRCDTPRVVRIIEGVSGSVTLRFELKPRFAYGLTVPRERSREDVTSAVAGPGLVLRYKTTASNDGLSGEEGVFVACSFWLASTSQMMGRNADAHALFMRVADLRNDVGLLSEEYLTREKCQTGNFPQAFSHLALVNAAYMLADGRPPPI